VAWTATNADIISFSSRILAAVTGGTSMAFLSSPEAEPPNVEVLARFKQLSCEQVASLVRAGLSLGPALGPDAEILAEPVTTTRAAQVRCPIRDCPGHAGWVIEQLIGDPKIMQYPFLLYVAPRGYKLDEAGVFVPTERMKEQRRRGYKQTVGRKRNSAERDVLAEAMTDSGMPAETWAFGASGWLARCPNCRAPRYLRITEEVASKELAKERCGIVS
jgi:hypothetical protein